MKALFSVEAGGLNAEPPPLAPEQARRLQRDLERHLSRGATGLVQIFDEPLRIIPLPMTLADFLVPPAQ